jgi:hypothetical protein
VIPVPDDEAGELPRAYVALNSTKAASEVQEKDIYEGVKEKVAPYKELNGGVIFTDAIPKALLVSVAADVLQLALFSFADGGALDRAWSGCYFLPIPVPI